MDDAIHTLMLTTWEGPAVGLLDLDAFFASVEMLDHPEWRGKPVIVGGSAEKRGVVSTASYEARKYGVHSAMPSAQAKKLCPNAIWTQGNYSRYSEVSAQVMAIVLDETPYVEQVSIDEAFFDITPARYSKENPIEVCQRIQHRVADLGITCSIGLGKNKTIAKIASEQEKPRGLTVVLPGYEQSFLSPLPVRAMSGIGPKTEEKLSAFGIHTLGDLAKTDEDKITQLLGSYGPAIRLRAQGLEVSTVLEEAHEELPKSVSNERTFEKDLVDPNDAEAACKAICTMVGRRLRKKNLKGTTLTLKLKFDAIHTHTIQTQLEKATDDEWDFIPVAITLLNTLWNKKLGIRLLGVGLSGFDKAVYTQMTLDTRDTPAKNLTALSQATDKVRARFGSESLAYGSELKFKGRTSDTQPTGKQIDS